MEILTTRINIANLRNVLNAAEALQEAGEQDKAQDCLRPMARSIDDHVGPVSAGAPLPPPIPDKPMRKGG